MSAPGQKQGQPCPFTPATARYPMGILDIPVGGSILMTLQSTLYMDDFRLLGAFGAGGGWLVTVM